MVRTAPRPPSWFRLCMVHICTHESPHEAHHTTQSHLCTPVRFHGGLSNQKRRWNLESRVLPTRIYVQHMQTHKCTIDFGWVYLQLSEGKHNNNEIAWLMLYKKVALGMDPISFCQLQRVLYRHSRVGGPFNGHRMPR